MATSDKPATTEEAYRELEKARSNEDVSFGMKMILSGLKLKFPDVRDISTASLTSLLEASPENVVLLDCRDDIEFAVSHLDGSVRVDFKTEDVKGLVGTVPALNNQNDLAEKTVVCYCSLGYRSSAMAQKLSAFFSQQSNKGPKGVYNLEGSIFKWANESRPMVDSSGQPTIFAHPYNQVWGKVLSKHLRKEEP